MFLSLSTKVILYGDIWKDPDTWPNIRPDTGYKKIPSRGSAVYPRYDPFYIESYLINMSRLRGHTAFMFHALALCDGYCTEDEKDKKRMNEKQLLATCEEDSGRNYWCCTAQCCGSGSIPR